MKKIISLIILLLIFNLQIFSITSSSSICVKIRIPNNKTEYASIPKKENTVKEKISFTINNYYIENNYFIICLTNKIQKNSVNINLYSFNTNRELKKSIVLSNKSNYKIKVKLPHNDNKLLLSLADNKNNESNIIINY